MGVLIMKKTLTACGMCAIATLSLLPFAHATGVPYTIQRAETGIFLGYGQLAQNYAETQSGATLDAETGSIPALTIGASGISSNPQGGLYWRMSYTHASGSTNYNGQTLGGTPVQTTTTNTIKEWHARLGEAFGFSRMALIPYFGLGFHNWVRDVPNSAGGIEHYSDGHMGVGLLGDLALGHHWVIGVHVLEGYTVGAQIQATLPYVLFNLATGAPVAPVSATGTYALGDRPYWDVGLKGAYLINHTWQVYLRVRQTHFAYGASSPNDAGYYEPDSHTTQTLISAGVAAHF